MPIPASPPPRALGTPIVDSTNVLTVTPDLTTQSMLITVDMTGWNGTGGIGGATAATRVSVFRGDGTRVRGLDGIAAFGGVTSGIDHEATLGVLVTYTAVLTDGTTKWTTGAVGSLLPRPPRHTWVKSLLTPSLSMKLLTSTRPAGGRGIAVASVQGDLSPFPAVSEGTRLARGGTVSVITETDDGEVALDQLTLSPGPFLIQYDSTFDPSNRRDQYVHIGPTSYDNAPLGGWRVWTLPLTEVGRPFTNGSVVDLPGQTWADVPAGTTWAAMPSVAWVDLPVWMF